mgnify:CR=1 FL=1|jgi:hypothetical protein|tara:strand:+ start:2446 stop:2916 length:471 start_codon:yes stop_codon:yes gene_type:complete
MNKLLEFSINIPAEKTSVIKILTDYEGLLKYLPDQLKSIKIIKSTKDETITEEEIVFSSILKKSIIQTCSHSLLNDNLLQTKILSGPAENSIIDMMFENTVSGTKISSTINLKLSLKAKILSPFINKAYKMVLTGVLYKVNTDALEISPLENNTDE